VNQPNGFFLAETAWVLEQQRHLVYLKQEELISKGKVVSARSLKNAYIGKDNDDEEPV